MATAQVATDGRERRGWNRGVLAVVNLGGAAGAAGLTYDLPLSVITELQAVTFTLTTAAGGGARQVVFEIRDGFGVTVYGIAAPGTQAGGLSVVYSFARDVTVYGSSALGFMGGPVPGGWLPENLSLLALVTGAAAGDLITNARMLVRQRPSSPDDST